MLANISKLSCTFRSLERVYLDYVWYALKSMNLELKCLSILEIFCVTNNIKTKDNKERLDNNSKRKKNMTKSFQTI